MRRFLLLIVLMISTLTCARREARPTDVILITIDTLRADALGFTGNTRVRTPFLDSLAARGTVFTKAHAHNVVTLPSHANILTGLYPWQHGIRDNAGFALKPETATLATILRTNGFATGAFVSAFPLDSRYGLDNGFDTYDDRYRAATNALDFAVQERPGSETLAAARTWWQSNSGRPRFLFVHLYEPHAPYHPPSPYREQYTDDPYLGEIAATDAMLAATLGDLLRDNPNALVIITADHGEARGDHGEQTHGLFAYESTLAVPLVVVDGERKPAKDERYVRHIDIAPTILARAGIEQPADWKGASLFAEGERGHTYFEALSASLNRGWAPLVGVIANGRKLIELPLPELYALPDEKTNRYQDDRRNVVALRNLLKADAPAPVATRGDVSSEQQANLLSLGYLAGTSTKTTFTVADDPKNLVTLDNELHKAIAAYQTGHLDHALALARKLVAQRPDMQIAQEMLAFFLGQSEKPDEAISLLQRQVSTGEASDAMRIRLGLMLSESGRAQEALEVLRPYASKDDPDLLNAYGIALADSGDARGAIGQFERVLSLDRENAKAYQNLGIVALRSGDAGRARQYLTQALTLNDRLPLALNTMGVVEAQAGNYDAAMTMWSKAVTLDGNQLDALYNLGLVAANRGRRDVAAKALRDYLDRAPEARFAAERAKARQVLGSVQ
ncbi:MAG TPA: sulfatase-like hydrolase/transferase [Thermoanaerobaculia bacterium]